jgi:hypothetical protein
MHKCSCGDKYETKAELREHIALLTPKWPGQRCTMDHHDPSCSMDRASLGLPQTEPPTC